MIRYDLPVSVSDPFVVTVGGAGGPRVATLTLTKNIGGYIPGTYVNRLPHLDIMLSIDRRYDEFQGVGEFRKRVCRIGVRMFKDISTEITAQRLPATVTRAQNRVEFASIELVEGFERRFRARYEFRLEGQSEEAVLATARQKVAAHLKSLSQALHGAIEKPANATFFGEGW